MLAVYDPYLGYDAETFPFHSMFKFEGS
jgi:hypothetical protein